MPVRVTTEPRQSSYPIVFVTSQLKGACSAPRVTKALRDVMDITGAHNKRAHTQLG